MVLLGAIVIKTYLCFQRIVNHRRVLSSLSTLQKETLPTTNLSSEINLQKTKFWTCPVILELHACFILLTRTNRPVVSWKITWLICSKTM